MFSVNAVLLRALGHTVVEPLADVARHVFERTYLYILKAGVVVVGGAGENTMSAAEPEI